MIFFSWKEELLAELKKLLGPMSESVPLDPEIVWEAEEDNLIKRRVLLNTEADMSVAALVYIPKRALKKSAPAILCNHGHGQFGKDSVMGVRLGNNAQRNIEIDKLNYDYGLQMAKRGFITVAIDWRGFGERGDYYDVYDANPFPNRDKCKVLLYAVVMRYRKFIKQPALPQNMKRRYFRETTVSQEKRLLDFLTST